MSLSFSNMKKLFPAKKRYTTDGPSEIGLPSNVNHVYHVTRNEETGQLEGLPDPWLKQLNTQLSYVKVKIIDHRSYY